MAGHGAAWRGWARQTIQFNGKDRGSRRGVARQGTAWLGEANVSLKRRGMAGRGKAGLGVARRGKRFINDYSKEVL